MITAKRERNDFFHATRPMMGGAEEVESIDWDNIFNRSMAVEPVSDARGNVISGAQNVVNQEGESLAIHGGRFSLTQPVRFKEMVQESLEGVESSIDFACSLKNERLMVVGVNIHNLSNFKVGNEAHYYQHVFGMAIDGSMSKFTSGLMERLACSNQFAMVAANAAGRAKNTANGEAKFANILQELSVIEHDQQAYGEACERLANEALTSDEAYRFAVGFLAKGEKVSAQAQKVVDDVMDRFTAGIETYGLTRYDMFNAITERFTHVASRTEGGMFGSSVLGKGAAMKRDAMILLDPKRNSDKLAQVLKKGEILG